MVFVSAIHPFLRRTFPTCPLTAKKRPLPPNRAPNTPSPPPPGFVCPHSFVPFRSASPKETFTRDEDQSKTCPYLSASSSFSRRGESFSNTRASHLSPSSHGSFPSRSYIKQSPSSGATGHSDCCTMHSGCCAMHCHCRTMRAHCCTTHFDCRTMSCYCCTTHLDCRTMSCYRRTMHCRCCTISFLHHKAWTQLRVTPFFTRLFDGWPTSLRKFTQ
jgi:hypothetical protein